MSGEEEACPQCGGLDVSTGPVTSGETVSVCLTCGWDSEHGVTTELCRGACGRRVSKGLLCCDPCWARIPTRVPGFDAPWRSTRRRAQALGRYGSIDRFEAATEAAKAWLEAHPSRSVVSR